MTDLSFICANPVKHAPRPLVPVTHHVLPKSWGGKDINPDGSSNTVRICGTCHDNVHDLLNRYVHLGALPSWEALSHYSSAVRIWAAQAWYRRPSEKPPYTAASV